jgi:hypothetical protein
MTDNEIADEALYKAGATAQGCWDKLDEYDKAAFQRALTLVAVEARRAERERIAAQIDRMPFGDTAASFSIWIREGAK